MVTGGILASPTATRRGPEARTSGPRSARELDLRSSSPIRISHDGVVLRFVAAAGLVFTARRLRYVSEPLATRPPESPPACTHHKTQAKPIARQQPRTNALLHKNLHFSTKIHTNSHNPHPPINSSPPPLLTKKSLTTTPPQSRAGTVASEHRAWRSTTANHKTAKSDTTSRRCAPRSWSARESEMRASSPMCIGHYGVVLRIVTSRSFSFR